VRSVPRPLAGLPPDGTPPRVVGSNPADGAVGVPAKATILLVFSEPIAVTSVGAATVRLSGPQGSIASQVVPAEGGLLAAVTPTAPLQPGTLYTLHVDGVVDTAGLRAPPVRIRFTTGGATAPPSSHASRIVEGHGTVPPGEDDTRVARDPRTGKPMSPWQSLPPLRAPEGVTAVSGQVLQLNGEPLENVTFEIEGVAARSDATGRFLLTHVQPGHRVLTMEGRTANRPGVTYGVFDVSVDVRPRQTHVLPYTVWMPKLDTVNVVTLSSPTTGRVVIRTPKIPGLEIHLEQGTMLEDRHGRPVTQVGITPIPPDRPPFPLPEPFAMYFTIQPGGISLTRGARAVYPNTGNAAEGKSWDFWSYEPEGGVGWYRYGKGRVRAGRKHIDPDPDARIYKITVHGCCPLDDDPEPSVGPAPGSPNGADPVNLSSGLFVLEKTDLVVPDVIPIVIRRTYRPEDPTSRGFGVGTNHPYGMTLKKVGSSATGWQEANLILPDGGRVRYQMIQSGPLWPTDWRWEHRDTPTAFLKSQLRVVQGDHFHLTLRDGTTYVFEEHSGRLLEQRDRYGNRLVVTRRLSTGAESVTGDLIVRVTSPHGRWVDFVYGPGDRIRQLVDQLGRAVTYDYDGSGRLVKVTNPAGAVTEYTYDAAGRMATITDARGTVMLTNEYYTTGPDTGRVKKQTFAGGVLNYQFAYTNDAQGRIVRRT